MRISSLINSLENGLIVAARATAQQARRINHAMSVELAAKRLVDAEAAQLKLAERPMVEAFEITSRAEELLAKDAVKAQRNAIVDARSALAKAIKNGVSLNVIAAGVDAIDELERNAS